MVEWGAGGDAPGAVYAAVYDLVPRAFAKRPDPDDPVVPVPWRQAARVVFPHRVHDDPFEVSVSGEPYLAIDGHGALARMMLRVDGVRGLQRLAGILDASRVERLEGLLAGAARFEGEAETCLVEADLAKPGSDVPVPDRSMPTDHLVAPALGALIEAGLGRASAEAVGSFPTGPVPCLVVAAMPIDPSDAVGTRRTANRLVDLWRPVWGLPTPGPVPASGELDQRLGVAYRRSLRQIAVRRPHLEKAALRVEVRELVRLYREAGRVRPRLLSILAGRLRVE